MCSFKIEIVTSVFEKLKRFKDGAFGTLLTSPESDSGLIVLGLVVTDTGGDESKLVDTELGELHTPGGLMYLGNYVVTASANHAGRDLYNDLIIQIHPETSKITATHVDHGTVELSVIDDAEIANKFFMVRTRMAAPFSCEITESAIRSTIDDWRNKMGDVVIAELENCPSDRPYLPQKTRKSANYVKEIEILELSVFLKTSVSYDSDDDAVRGILIDYKKGVKKCCWFDLPIDTLTLVERKEPAGNIADLVGLSLRQYLTLYENCLISQLEKDETISVPESFHFLPQSLAHFVSVVYPKKKLDRDLGELRTFLHEAFVLPSDRPQLMRGNAFLFEEEEGGRELLCPHEGVPPSGVVGGEPSLVEGRYAYHHYCQQGMDDDGWGCAYRSLQTLCSWFKLQGYTNRAVPTLKEIQECLVSIGDKPANFVGSRQWIGSAEVGFCLDTLLGVASRFSIASSGEEMSTKGGELSHHFRTQGTPVMIGGGSLAHTILGVDYNKKTGDIKFLILDPHYTGSEDLNIIIAKGWCGWKDLKFWKKGCFYNMCMPIRPKCI